IDRADCFSSGRTIFSRMSAVDLCSCSISNGTCFSNGIAMSSVLEKSLSIVELLVDHPEGLPVSAIAGELNQPASGVHRTLQELERQGTVRQLHAHGDYAMTKPRT